MTKEKRQGKIIAKMLRPKHLDIIFTIIFDKLPARLNIWLFLLT